ncbi:MAG: hypothetical protein OEL20_02720 [Sulfuritalea sp.]|nr:hypothetical protein [Sulfuritalea sp.]
MLDKEVPDGGLFLIQGNFVALREVEELHEFVNHHVMAESEIRFGTLCRGDTCRHLLLGQDSRIGFGRLLFRKLRNAIETASLIGKAGEIEYENTRVSRVLPHRKFSGTAVDDLREVAAYRLQSGAMSKERRAGRENQQKETDKRHGS